MSGVLFKSKQKGSENPTQDLGLSKSQHSFVHRTDVTICRKSQLYASTWETEMIGGISLKEIIFQTLFQVKLLLYALHPSNLKHIMNFSAAPGPITLGKS